MHALPLHNMDNCHVLRQSKVFCCYDACLGALVRLSWGWRVLDGPMDSGLKTMAALHHVPAAQLLPT